MTETEGSERVRYHIDDLGPIPPWRQVADHLLGRIEAGEFPDGQLPRQKDLTAQYDVAQGAVIDALTELRDNNIVYTIAGRGTFLVPSDGEVPAKHRTRKAPRPEIGRQAWPLIDVEEASRMIERLNTFGENMMRVLQDINRELAETSRFAKSSIGRLAYIENAVSELIRPPKREPESVSVEHGRPTSNSSAGARSSRNSRTRLR